ncbi:MAG: twin-arginine translocase TatA/TatE family subunit [Bacteroidales bacterium]|nr:twin-arginine translocase TatA/TatE family subunit [Bacteroidales bacterium]
MIAQPLLLFLDVSGGELLVIILVVFLVFGPDKMPDIARKFGKAMNSMKKASNDLTREFRQETSGIRSEIQKTQAEVKDELNKVQEEVAQTRARVVNDISIPKDTFAKPDKTGNPPETPDGSLHSDPPGQSL